MEVCQTLWSILHNQTTLTGVKLISVRDIPVDLEIIIVQLISLFRNVVYLSWRSCSFYQAIVMMFETFATWLFPISWWSKTDNFIALQSSGTEYFWSGVTNNLESERYHSSPQIKTKGLFVKTKHWFSDYLYGVNQSELIIMSSLPFIKVEHNISLLKVWRKFHSVRIGDNAA